MSQIPNQTFATKLFFFQPAICSTPKKIPWFPRHCSIVRIPYGQSRSHWNSHSWVSWSESANCDLVSRHISPLFLTHSPTTSETYIIAFPDLIPFVCLRSVSLPSLKTCSHSTDLPWPCVTPHLPPNIITHFQLLVFFLRFQNTSRKWETVSKHLKFTEPHRLSHLQLDLLPPTKTGPDWLESNDHLASLMQIVRKMRWILGLGIPRQKDLAPLGISWPSPPGQCGRSSHNMHCV